MIGIQKSKNKILVFRNVLFYLIVFTVLSSITSQYIASQFAYNQQLAGHLFGSFYFPYSWVLWVNDYGFSNLKKPITVLFLSSAIVLIGHALFILMSRKNLHGVEGLHGSAAWAKKDEIIKTGLLAKNSQVEQKGVYVGGWKDARTGKQHYLRHDGPEHVLAFAPTRSGKGVGLVLPTLLSWQHSVICYDIKGENWALTSGWRKHHANNIVMKFDPTDDTGATVRYNPLAEVRLKTPSEVADVQNIASMIVDPEGKGLQDHWSKTGYALLTGTILHCLYKYDAEDSRVATLADVSSTLTDPNKPIGEVLNEMLTYPHLGSEPHHVVAEEARSMMNKAEQELSSVVSTAVSFLSLYKDPIVSRNTSYSDFSISDLMNNAKPVSLYLVIRPSDADRLRPLIRLFITQVIKKLTENMEFKDGASVKSYKHRLLLLLDEFASLKRLTAVEDGLAFMAGYGIKAYLIVQDLQQIVSNYTREEGITGNCHVRIAYAPNKVETAELLSKMSGVTTIIKKSKSYSGSMGKRQTSESVQEVSRPLITTDEVMRLPGPVKDESGLIKEPGDMLIFVAGQSAIYGKQILYFLDPVFSARSKVEAPVKSDSLPYSSNSRKKLESNEFTLS